MKRYLAVSWGQDLALIDRMDWSLVVMAVDNNDFDIYAPHDHADDLHDTDFEHEDSTWDDALVLLKERYPYKEDEALIKVAVFSHKYGIHVQLVPRDTPEGHTNSESSDEEIERIQALVPGFDGTHMEFVDVTTLKARESDLNRPAVEAKA